MTRAALTQAAMVRAIKAADQAGKVAAWTGHKTLSTGDAYACWMRPTHWMPLPEPPDA